MISKNSKLILILGAIAVLIELTYFGYIETGFTTVIVALGLGLAGIFRDWIRSQFYYPELDIKFNVELPDCHKTRCTFRNDQGQIVTADCYYYRLKISNIGNYRAKKIEVMIAEKSTQDAQGEFVKDKGFLPLNLKWSHDKRITRGSIAPSLFRNCDFGSIVHPKYTDNRLEGFPIKEKTKVVLDLELEVKPNTGTHLVFPGKHRLKIIAVADNSKAFSKIFEIDLKDFWDDNKRVMFENGLSVAEAATLT